MLSRGWTSATQSAQNLRLPWIFTAHNHDQVPCWTRFVLSWYSQLWIWKSFKQTTHIVSTSTHCFHCLSNCCYQHPGSLSLCFEVSHVAHVIKQNWFASCYCCHSCCFTVTWVPVCLWCLLSLGVMLVTRMRGNNSSMVILLYLVESLKLHRNMILINCTAISTLSTTKSGKQNGEKCLVPKVSLVK